MLIKFKNHHKLRQNIWKYLEPLVKDWSKEKISKDYYVYGIRRYLKGASLVLHVDRLPSHILSVILQVSRVGK